MLQIGPDGNLLPASGNTPPPPQIFEDRDASPKYQPGDHLYPWALGDSLRKIARPFIGTLRKESGRVSLLESERGFLRDLKAENDPSQARIFDFICEDTTNATLTALGHADLDIKVQILPHYKHINLRTLVTAQAIIPNQA